MGCGSSIQVNPTNKNHPIPTQHQLTFSNPIQRTITDNSPLTEEEINGRIISSQKSYTVKLLDNFSIQYAYVSQRGYYPDAIDKANQDAFSVIPKFNGDPTKYFFGVFDGHGSTGDLCAQYAKTEVPAKLQELLKIHKSKFMDAYIKCFTETNKQLHSSRIDDSLSGTTAICVFFDGDVIHVANVGDSRAIIARKEGNRSISHPLSADQTPFRSDERERVKNCGARVMTLDQLEGLAPIHENWGLKLGEEVDEEGDPPRIWSPAGNFPGTAFTRSIGDEIAESLGVYAEPEIVSLRIKPEDQFIVIASDGVFEFLTSQAVVDLVEQYPDPLTACQKVVSEAYRLWLHYEIRTDDITMICIRLNRHLASIPSITNIMGTPGHGNNTGTIAELEPAAATVLAAKTTSGDTILIDNSNNTKVILTKHVTENRPVRKGMSKARKRAQMKKDMAKMVTEEDMKYIISEHFIPKTSEEIKNIEETVKNNYLFRQLTPSQRADVISVMYKVDIKSGDEIIKQGDPGDRFYCVEYGNFEVKVSPDDKDLSKQEVIHTYFGDSHPSFGELALMHGNPRSSSVVAITKARLWAIDCPAFRKIFMKSPSNILIKTLKQVDILKSLRTRQIERLAEYLTQVSFEDGEYIIQQGEIGSTFYVILEGSVVCVVWDDEKDINNNTNTNLLNNNTTNSITTNNSFNTASRTNSLLRDSHEVLRLKENQYFGERALLNDAPRAANVISVGRTKLLQIGRAAFEEILGPLQDIIDADRKQREAAHNFEKAVSHAMNYTSSYSHLPIVDDDSDIISNNFIDPSLLLLNNICQITEIGYLASYKKLNKDLNDSTNNMNPPSFITVKIISKTKAKEYERTEEIMKNRTIYNYLNKITPRSPFIPNMITSWKNDNALYLGMDKHLICDLNSMISLSIEEEEKTNNGLLLNTENIVKEYAAQILLGLEKLHSCGYIYRNLNPDLLFIDENGYIQFYDHRYTKYTKGSKTYTLCGTPEYLAPEMIAGQGHDYSVDFWAYGVLLYDLLCGTTPFSLQNEQEKWINNNNNTNSINDKSAELNIYAKITRFHKGTLIFPLNIKNQLSNEVKDLISNLLIPSLSERLGCQGIIDTITGGSVIRSHSWFHNIDWVQIAARQKKGPQYDIIQKKKKTLIQKTITLDKLVELKEYKGDSNWFEGF